MNNNESRRAALRARRDLLKSEIFAMLGRLDDDRHAALSDQVHDTKDQSIAQLLLQSDDAELQRAARELQDVDSALQRIGAGTYGRCSDCGVGIPAARLAAYPTAKRCLPCQTAHEHGR